VTAMSADLRQLAADFAYASGAGIEQVSVDLVHEAAQAVADAGATGAPKRSGALGQSVQVSYRSPTYAEVGPTVPYGPEVEFGSRAHVIRARNGRALSFMVGSQRVTVRSVRHPGTRANPFMAEALAQGLQGLTARAAHQAAALITKGRR
jgi:hypothetical protein